MAEKKTTNDRKIIDLKIELLKNTTKRKSIKKEIARLLTMNNQTKLNKGASIDVPQDKEGNK
jgi:hypothetical protein